MRLLPLRMKGIKLLKNVKNSISFILHLNKRKIMENLGLMKCIIKKLLLNYKRE